MKPIKKENLSQLIFNDIAESIKSGEYGIGDKLPSENQLAKYYDVSRVPVREAISKLASWGYVESNQGKGSFVKNSMITDEMMQFTFDGFDTKELFDLLEMRTVIEVQSASMAAIRRSDEDLLKIEAALNDFRKITVDQKAIGVKADYDFHEAIVLATGNAFMIQTFSNLQNIHQNALEFSLKLNVGRPAKREQVFSEHENIFDAIRNQDSLRAEESMKAHLYNMRRKLGDERV
ncbi:FadR family transcriptional regulator [Salinicoccus sp. ID82-1]|nr:MULTISPECIES: FadR/GntR family transcriptional regulator [Salinicoccus]MCG1009809.1 FadR family transcriptional regulator [Salinicoccus sp. ID82-1]